MASPRVEPWLGAFDPATRKATITPSSVLFASGVTGRIMAQGPLDRHYWQRHARAPVRFREAAVALHARGARVFLVAGPESPSAPILSDVAESVLVLSSLRAVESDWLTMLNSLKRLYLTGAHVDWVGFDRDYTRSKIEAPTYPFQRHDYARVRVSVR
jgi:acyl transferase domain-containing protein